MRRRSELGLIATLSLVGLACQDPLPPRVPDVLIGLSSEVQQATVGTPVPIVPQVQVIDDRGDPLPGIEVRFAVTAGDGLVQNAVVRTGMDGVASAGAWVLGSGAGANELTASSGTLDPVLFQAMSVAGAAANMAIVAGDDQSGPVAEPLPAPPTVLVSDHYGNPVSDVSVAFEVTEGGGSLEIQEALTGPDGVAGAGTWQLGEIAGVNRVRAIVPAVEPIEFAAVGLPGQPALIAVFSGDEQIATVASTVAEPPRVIVADAYGNGVPDQTVRFNAESDGGSVGPALTQQWQAVSDADGVASAGTWMLGTGAGTQILMAELDGLPAIQFTAYATAAQPAVLEIEDGDGQTAVAGSPLPVPAMVRVTDTYGNPVEGVDVTYGADSGGAAVPTIAKTSAIGVARTTWYLGPTLGEQTLQAGLGALDPVLFHATAISGGGGGGGGGGYQIDIRYTDPISASQEAIFDAAVERWQELITGDLPDVNLDISADACGTGHPAVSEVVDDLLIYVTVVDIDGVGGVLGAAGPCVIRAGGGLPVFGAIRLDEADVANMESNGTLQDVILHEMGHVLGIGTRWGGLLVGKGSADPYFTGAAANAGFLDAGGAIYIGNTVPVENTGGVGTRDAHWRETVMTNELMTGWLSGATRPISAVTVGSLEDIGYVVDIGMADPFTLAGAGPPGAVLGPPPGAIQLREVPLPMRPRLVRTGR